MLNLFKSGSGFEVMKPKFQGFIVLEKHAILSVQRFEQIFIMQQVIY